MPGDELCYCVFEAPSIQAVRRAHELAQISCERIVEAFHVAALPPGIGGGASGTNSCNFLVLSAPVLAGSIPIGWQASLNPFGNDISAVYAICAK
jgi:hypothetical protein